jgi:hypothetical protein
MKSLVNVFLILIIATFLFGISFLCLDAVAATNQGYLPPVRPMADEESSYELVSDFNSDDDLPPCYDADGGMVTSCQIINNSYLQFSYDVTGGAITASARVQNDLYERDLSSWDSVWIVIRGSQGGEELWAEFKDCGPHYPKIKISDHLMGGITTTWRAAAIPFSAFDAIEVLDWSCIDRFSIIASREISSGSGQIEIDQIRFLPSTVLVDDFYDNHRRNELGGQSDAWFTPSVTISINFPPELELTYEVPAGEIGGGYWTSLISTNLLSQKDFLSFKIRGQAGGEEIAVEFQDCGINREALYPKIKVSDYLQNGITTTWQSVVIPLDAFAAVAEVYTNTYEAVEWNCIAQLKFNVSGEPHYQSGEGTVYIDDVKLIPYEDAYHRYPVLVDRFHDCDIWNAMSGEWHPVGITANLDTDVNRFGNNSCGYQFIYDLEGSDPGYIWTDFRGLDVTNYRFLEFYVRGKNGGEYFNVCLEDLVTGTNTHCEEIEDTTTDWLRKRIPLHSIDEIDLGELAAMKFDFYRDGFSQNSEIQVDDIRFMNPFTVTLPVIFKHYPPTRLYVRNDHTGGNVFFEVLGTGVSCNIPNDDNTPVFCGTFRPGRYTIRFTATCGTNTDVKTYQSGYQETRIFCP